MMSMVRVLLIAMLFFAASCTLLSDKASFMDGPMILNADIQYLFDVQALPEVTLSFTSNSWNHLLALHDSNSKSTTYVPVDFELIKNGVREIVQDAGVHRRGLRPEGNLYTSHNPSAPQWHAPNFKMDFNRFVPKQRLRSFKSLYLRCSETDPTYLREMYSFDLFRRMGVSNVPSISYFRLYVRIKEDPRRAYFGIYRFSEAVDDVFLENRFPDSKNGFLWSCSYVQSNSTGFPADLSVNNPEARIGIDEVNETNDVLSKRFCYNLETRKDELETVAKPQLLNFISRLNTLKGQDFVNWIGSAFAVDQFLRTLAVDVAVGGWDNYWVKGHNYYLYFDDSGLCHFFPYDFDTCLGSYDARYLDNPGIQNPFNYTGYGSDDLYRRPLVAKILAVPAYFATYSNYLAMLTAPANGLLDFNSSTNRLAFFRSMIRDYLTNEAGQVPFADDEPWFAGSTPFYRLFSGDASGAGPEANFFKTRINVIRSSLGLNPIL